jgi:hypothetical protein
VHFPCYFISIIMGVIGWVGGLEPGSRTDTGPREPVSVNAGYGDWLADEG